MRLLPKNEAFFDDFDRHTQLVVSAADELRQMTVANGGSFSDGAARINALEEEGDAIVHRVVRELRRFAIRKHLDIDLARG